MIEVLFGESEAASMKAAKSMKIVGYVNGPTSVLVTGKETPPERTFAGWVEGTSEDVVCLGFMLDIGNIKEPIDSPYRKNLIYSMYAQNQYVKNPEIDQELKLTGEVYLNELLTLKRISGKWGNNPSLVQRYTIFHMWFLQSVSDTAKV